MKVQDGLRFCWVESHRHLVWITRVCGQALVYCFLRFVVRVVEFPYLSEPLSPKQKRIFFINKTQPKRFIHMWSQGCFYAQPIQEKVVSNYGPHPRTVPRVSVVHDLFKNVNMWLADKGIIQYGIHRAQFSDVLMVKTLFSETWGIGNGRESCQSVIQQQQSIGLHSGQHATD